MWVAMRIACLLSLIPLALAGGCAGMIATSGVNLDNFESMNDVHTKFGEPCATGSTKGSCKEDDPVPQNAAFYEEYRTRLKIADRDWCDGDGYAIFLISTAGTIEFFLFPQQLYYLTKHTITGQTLRIIYDTNGKVIAGQLDGKYLGLRPHYLTKEHEGDSKHESDSPPLPPPSFPSQP
jgi:hypothetical protein